MTISNHIKSQYFVNEEQLIRIAPSQPLPHKPTKRKGTPWTDEEHNRFLEALEQYPAGPWKRIAEHVRTRTTRQTMTHAQRYREKIARRRRTLAEAGLPVLHLSDEPLATSASAAAVSSEARAAGEDDSSSDEDDGGADGRSGDVDMTAIDGTTLTFASSSANYAFDFNEIEFEDIEDDRLLLALVESSGDPDLFSEEDAQWLAEHYSSISLDNTSLVSGSTARLSERF